jgi:hypothetical protein
MALGEPPASHAGKILPNFILVIEVINGIFSGLLYESRHSSEIFGGRNPLRLRQRDQDPLHQAGHHRRHL